MQGKRKRAAGEGHVDRRDHLKAPARRGSATAAVAAPRQGDGAARGQVHALQRGAGNRVLTRRGPAPPAHGLAIQTQRTPGRPVVEWHRDEGPRALAPAQSREARPAEAARVRRNPAEIAAQRAQQEAAKRDSVAKGEARRDDEALQLGKVPPMAEIQRLGAQGRPLANVRGRTANVIQRDNIFRRAWRALVRATSKKSLLLGLEGVGHVTAGVLGVIVGAGAITSAVLAAPGLLAVLAGLGQIAIGVSKWIRAAILALANHYKNGRPSPAQKKAMATLTAIEGAIWAASAIAGGISVIGAGSVALGVKIASAIMNFVGSIGALVKTVRGTVSFFTDIPKKALVWMLRFESWTGVLTNYGSVIAGGFNAGKGMVLSLIKEIVNGVKTMRSEVVASEAANVQPLNAGKNPKYGSMDQETKET